MPSNWLDKYHQSESADLHYSDWLADNAPRKSDLIRMSETWASFPYQPLISVITPVYNSPKAYLREAIESVLSQVYPHWELCIADDASTEPHVKKILHEYEQKDCRIKITYRDENGHISNCSNSALALATGDFVALLDHDDLLTPDALYEVVLLLNQHPEADMIYSDEDKIDLDGKLVAPYFKPEWSPDSFFSRMYTCHLGVYRRELVELIGGFRVGYEGSQDYDLVLRLTEKTEQIFHIAKILYHWRIHTVSAASGGEAKPYTCVAAEKALNEALIRRGEVGSVKAFADLLGAYITRYQIVDCPLVSIILQTNTIQSLYRCLEAILANTHYSHYEIVVVSPQLSSATVSATFSNLSSAVCLKYVCGFSTNSASQLNKAVRQTNGRFLLFLQDSVEPISHDWIDGLVEQAQRSSIGCASALLLHPNNTVWHAGMVLGLGDVAGRIYPHLPAESLANYGQIISINNYSTVTGACMMCRREAFEQVHGFTETLAAEYYDVDLCLKMGEQGLRHVFLPHVVLRYHESSQSSQLQSTKDRDYMYKRWGQIIRRDPHYSPNLSLETSYAIKIDSRKAAERHDFNQLAFQLYETQKSLKEAQERLQAMKSRLKSKLAYAQSETEQIRVALEETQQRLEAMETSKFWKLRQSWFQFKKALGFSLDE